MKRMIIAVCLILLVTVAVIINSFFVTNTITDITNSLSILPQTEVEFGDGLSAAESVAAIEQTWNKKMPIFELTLLLDESRAITLLLSDLRLNCEVGDFDLYKVNAERLRLILEKMSESEKVTLYSVL